MSFLQVSHCEASIRIFSSPTTRTTNKSASFILQALAVDIDERRKIGSHGGRRRKVSSHRQRKVTVGGGCRRKIGSHGGRQRKVSSRRQRKVGSRRVRQKKAAHRRGEGENNVVNRRMEVVNLLQEVEKKNSLEAAQKRNQLSIRGILVEGTWIDSPSLVKKCQVSKEDIKKAMWDCGIDKSPIPDGFTFGFYRQYWKLIENDVIDAVTCFFIKVKSCYLSLWLDIIHEVDMFKSRGIDLVSLIHSKLGNGMNTSFWEEAWRGGSPLKSLFPRLYALKTQKKIDVASKLSHPGLDVSFHRPPRGGVKIQQFDHMKEKVKGCILADMMDR
nr:RNA-directed DNA polymerase, eukaryota, reverse transcriptase zinc-binding domain protein [Tanacetum cinerariifolium]